MKVSTFNIKNDYGCYRSEKSKEIFNYIENYDIDILGLQEVFSKCNNDLLKLFGSVYNMIGKYRFFSKILLRRFNEKNPIITKYSILFHKTYRLPFFPSLTKRIMTHIVINYNGREISIYNTHLEVKILPVKQRQLKKIYNIIKKDNRPKILMGDFNLKNNNHFFNRFISDLEKLGIKRVKLGEKTLKESQYSREIDHIFISKEFKLISKEVVKSLEISDHYPVIVNLEI